MDWCTRTTRANLDQKVAKSESFFGGFLVERDLFIGDHSCKLFRAMFPDSKTANKPKSGQRKNARMLTGVVSKQTTNDLKEGLSMTWYGMTKNGRSNEDDNYLPILILHVGKIRGLSETSLLDIPNIRSSVVSDWELLIILEQILNITNSMVGRRSNMLMEIKASQAEQNVFDVGCPCRLNHICPGKEAS